MKKLLLIIPLLIWVSCEDNDDSHPLDGIWEFKSTEFNGDWVDWQGNFFWVTLTEDSYAERNSSFNPDSSVCYNPAYEYPLEISKEEDNYRLEVFYVSETAGSFVFVCSLQDGILYWRSNGSTDWQYKLEKISSFDFTPLCE